MRVQISAMLWVVAVTWLASATQAQTIGDVLAISGPDRIARLVEGAKREGTLTLYSSATVEDSKAMIAGFETKYGVQVRLWRGGSEEIVQRTVTEQRAGRYDVDAAETAGPDMEALTREKLLAEVNLPVFADLIPQAIMQHRAYVITRLSIFTAAYNTNLIKKEDLPRSYADLLEPKWKGRLGIEAEDANWLMSVAGIMGEDKTIKLFKDIVARNGMSVRKGHTLLSNLVASGEVPFALTVYGYRVEQLKAAGAPVDGLYLPPVVALPTGIGVMQRPPHPHAAVLYMDYVLTDGQKVLMERGNTPTNRKVKELPPGLELVFVDSAKLLDEGDKWTRLFKQTFLGQAR